MNVTDAVYTYSTILFALFVAHISTITAVGGFVLLLVRLIVEVPKAVQTIREWRKNRG